MVGPITTASVYSFFGFVLGTQRFVEKVAGFGADREQHGVDSVQV
jgi:hypothetical protein